MQEGFQLDALHRSGDSVGQFYYNFFGAGDQLGWHFDNSEFSMNLILADTSADPKAGGGGKFVFIPDSRKQVEAM